MVHSTSDLTYRGYGSTCVRGNASEDSKQWLWRIWCKIETKPWKGAALNVSDERELVFLKGLSMVRSVQSVERSYPRLEVDDSCLGTWAPLQGPI